MTQEEKDILIKDLCVRLPYGVIVETPKGKGHVCDINLTIFGTEAGVNINATSRDKFNIEDIKPYLFPLSSMTEEQYKEFYDKYCWSDGGDNFEMDSCSHSYALEKFEWLIKNHFDYRGLIPMGLAKDATGLNIY